MALVCAAPFLCHCWKQLLTEHTLPAKTSLQVSYQIRVELHSSSWSHLRCRPHIRSHSRYSWRHSQPVHPPPYAQCTNTLDGLLPYFPPQSQNSGIKKPLKRPWGREARAWKSCIETMQSKDTNNSIILHLASLNITKLVLRSSQQQRCGTYRHLRQKLSPISFYIYHHYSSTLNFFPLVSKLKALVITLYSDNLSDG